MAHLLSKVPILCKTTFHRNIIYGCVTKITRVKSYEHCSNKTNPFVEQKFRFKDNISNDYKLIYREQGLINVITTIAYNSGWIGVILSVFFAGYIIYENPVEKEIRSKVNDDETKPLSNLNRAVIVLFTFAISVSIILCSRIIPFRIYYSSAEKLYKAVFVRLILGKKQIVTFGKGTAVPTFKRKYLGDILFNINGRTILLDKECFPVPHTREQMIHRTN